MLPLVTLVVVAITVLACGSVPPTETIGQGVKKLSVKELTHIASQGDVKAQFELGLKYYYGFGVPENYESTTTSRNYMLAYYWTDLAASRASGEDAERYQSVRDEIAAFMTPEQIAEAKQHSPLE